jgi:hypothetical protein
VKRPTVGGTGDQPSSHELPERRAHPGTRRADEFAERLLREVDRHQDVAVHPSAPALSQVAEEQVHVHCDTAAINDGKPQLRELTAVKEAAT